MRTYVLVGNYGVGNVGDDALQEYFTSTFPDVQWKIVSAQTGEHLLPRLPFGIRSFFRPWWRTISAIRSSDGIVFGGGSLFTDVESIKAPLLWAMYIVIAKLFRRSVLLAFQGIGPFRTRIGNAICLWSCTNAAFVSVRDQESLRRLSEVSITNVVQTFDPVFSQFSAYKHSDRTQNILSIIPRVNSGQNLIKSIEKQLEHFVPLSIRILSMEPESASERDVVAYLTRTFSRHTITTRQIRSWEELCEEIVQSSHCISERFHGALCAFALSVPVTIVFQKEGDKLWALDQLITSGISKDTLLSQVKVGEDSLREALR